ncbi:MAG TPA: zinc ABC transporter substrate-binding protein [Nitrososphaera sp.]
MRQSKAALAAIAVVIPLAMVATIYTGGQPAGTIATERKVQAVASFYPLYDFASNVARDRATVTSLVPPGIEPHDWEPTLGDVTRVRSADMLIINGAGFEAWADGIGARKIVNTSEGIELEAVEGEQDGHGAVDPHIWLDPVLAKQQVEAIRAALAQADPANAEYYSENVASYGAELDSLDSFIRSELSNCEKSEFIAFHDAFGRFAERYGLEQHAIHDISPEGEVLPQRLQEVIELARSLGISVIYSEDLVDPRLAEVVAGEIPGGRVLVLSPIEGIDADERAAGIDYIAKMRENVANLREGLQCP